MDFNYDRMAWVADVRQKFETLCLEETFRNVENKLQSVGIHIESKLQAVGANIKELCSEFVHDVLPALPSDSVEGEAPELSPQQDKDIDFIDPENSLLDIEAGSDKGICNKNSLVHPSVMESIEGDNSNPLSKQKSDTGVHGKLHEVEDRIVEKPCPTEISVATDIALVDSTTASISHEVNRFSGERRDVQVNLSSPTSLARCDCCAKELEATNVMNALPSSNSIVVVDSCKCRVSNTGVIFGDGCPPASNDSCWAGLELSKVVPDSEDYVSVAHNGTEGADKSTDGLVIELGVETVQFNELELDGGSDAANSSKFCFVCLTAAKSQPYKKRTCEHHLHGFEDLDAESSERSPESSASNVDTSTLETADHEFCDSEWEMI
ncbi:uncharacterized protein LOC127808233 isoform X2 [Diospyros lotus]|uniref:uncharacterized protein LOC127808233 isoform X2 n=1 Tax=Diospyros lotus TaxID=55363 RepID=UPI0022571653|nr:uncharacterized protein LOC127808233 isoform X2 [Diospyros lotus]